MILYKWVIEENNEYFPLINYNIDGNLNIKLSPYKINKIYKNPIDLYKKENRGILKYERKGFHFWNSCINSTLNRWNKYLKHKKQPTINGVLKCEVWKIIGAEIYQGEGIRILAEAFKPISFIKIK